EQTIFTLGILLKDSHLVGGKIFRRCELAHLLKVSGLEGYRGYSLADWVCLAFYESHFDTAIVDHEADGSTSNGIFQINSHLWCEDYKHFQPNFCKMHCILHPGIRGRCSAATWDQVAAEFPAGTAATAAAFACKVHSVEPCIFA
uniref:Sperm acrosome associated 3 n=1 Tax=Podarcis muralis TaxID=64176 RepID=A0A670JZI1_PODMU